MHFRDLLILHSFKNWHQRLTELEKEVLSGRQREPAANTRESALPSPTIHRANQDLQRRMRTLLSHQEFTPKTGFKFEMTEKE